MSSARSELLAYALKERAEVRRMQASGECTGEDRPQCYETCKHAYWCSELKHQIRLPF